MKLARTLRKLEKELENFVEPERESRSVLRNIGLVSAGIAVLAASVVLGRELRARYKFQRRTPYDMYAHAGADSMPDADFGVGI